MPSSTAYLNFDLLITRAGDRYRALVVDAPGGDADIFFELPPSLPDFQDLLEFAAPRRGGNGGLVPTAPTASLDDVGRLLYETIFQGQVRDVLVASQREAADNAAGLRLRLRFHEDAANLATLPWEILYDASHEQFLALSSLFSPAPQVSTNSTWKANGRCWPMRWPRWWMAARWCWSGWPRPRRQPSSRGCSATLSMFCISWGMASSMRRAARACWCWPTNATSPG
jgi:hypothetical protein